MQYLKRNRRKSSAISSFAESARDEACIFWEEGKHNHWLVLNLIVIFFFTNFLLYFSNPKHRQWNYRYQVCLHKNFQTWGICNGFLPKYGLAVI